jgi:hypothetical protein
MKQNLLQIDPSLWLRLRIEAKHRGTHVSELISEALKQFLGISVPLKMASQSSNIETLAGTWTAEDAMEFERNTEAFGQIDEDMWK